MKIIRGIAILVLIVQIGNIANILFNDSMGHGAGFDTFLAGMHSPWQNMINSDLVMGLLFTIAWVVFRESGGPVLPIIAWAWMAAWWGNIVIAVYVLKASRQAGSDPAVFFLGRHAVGYSTISSQARPGWVRAVSAAAAALALVYLVYGLYKCGLAPIPAIGYFAGIGPIVLSLALLAGI